MIDLNHSLRLNKTEDVLTENKQDIQGWLKTRVTSVVPFAKLLFQGATPTDSDRTHRKLDGLYKVDNK